MINEITRYFKIEFAFINLNNCKIDTICSNYVLHNKL